MVNKRGGPTNNLNINKRGGGGRWAANKMEGGLKSALGQKWQPVITTYGCPKQLLIIEKHQHNF